MKPILPAHSNPAMKDSPPIRLKEFVALPEGAPNT